MEKVIPEEVIRNKIEKLEKEGQEHLKQHGWFPMTIYSKIETLKELIKEN